MEEAISFLEGLVRCEHEAELARAGDPDAVFAAKLHDVDYFSNGFAIVAPRSEGLSKERLAELAKERVDLRQRKIFAVQQYAHWPKGDLFRAFLSGNRAWTCDAFDSLAYMQREAGSLQAISWYARCLDCEGTGTIRRGRYTGQGCRFCSGLGWRRPRGLTIIHTRTSTDRSFFPSADGKLTSLVATRKIAPPGNAVDREVYDAMKDHTV